MRIHEVLIENQLNEEILTELDWSKIKKGLAAGVISLGALGISSGASASDKDGSYEKQLTPAQAMQIIKQKLQQGEIKPAEIKQAVQKVDAAPEIKKAEPKVDVKPEINKSESPFDKLSGKILTRAGDSGEYKIVDVKSVGDEGKWVLSARLNKDNTVTYSTRMFNISSGTEIVQDGRNSASTDTEKNPLAVMKAIWEKGPNLRGKEVNISNGTIQSMYLDHLKSEFPTAKKEISKDDNTTKFLKMGEDAPYKVARLIKRTAFDGDSLKFNDWTMKAVTDDSGGTWLIITGSVNGKNKLGAYVGFKEFLATIDPDTGEVQKLYMENDPKYLQAVALISKFKTNLSKPVSGPSAGKWGLF